VIRTLTLGLLACCVLVAAPASAGAADAVLWACHGPDQQPLGAGSLTAPTSGDGTTSSYGGGCATAGTQDTAGLAAGFTTPSPATGSAAAWQLLVPSGVTLRSVTVTRKTTGFGGTPVAGGGLSYATTASGTTLEAASVEDASNAALDGTFNAPSVIGSYVRVGVACAAALNCAPPTSTPVAVGIGAIALGVSDDSPPAGAVGGITDPAIGSLSLSIRAIDTGLGLYDASASIDGTVMATAMVGGTTCVQLPGGAPGTVNLSVAAACNATADDIPLVVPVTAIADGAHELTVVIHDAAGNATTIADETITVANTPVTHQSSATLTIGSPTPGTDTGTGTGPTGTGTGVGGQSGNPGSGGPVCLSPLLSMFLSQKPLRMTHELPVLRGGGRYRYTGRLTCLVDGERSGASIGSVIELLNVVKGRLVGKSGTTTRSGGGITMILAYRSSRTVEFRYRSVDGTASRVKIKIVIQARKRRHASKHKR
jgi:hypothetical protein